MEPAIRVINLLRSADRKEVFIRNNPNLDYEFFTAVDAKLLTRAQLNDSRFFIQPLSAYTLGSYGCALSHLALWEQVIESGRAITVAEDDAIFRADFATSSRKVLAQLPSDWDLVMWGWNFDAFLSAFIMPGVSTAAMLFNQDALRENIRVFKNSTTPSLAFGLNRSFGTPAYSISPAGARKFKSGCFPLQHFQLDFPGYPHPLNHSGIDIAMNRLYSQTASFVSFPPLAAVKNETRLSTVQDV